MMPDCGGENAVTISLPPVAAHVDKSPARAPLSLLQASPLAAEVLISGTGVACGTTLTNPIDVVKTRLQLHTGVTRPPGMLATGMSIVRSEGVTVLWAGWTPAIARAMLYGGLRLGLYNPIKNALADARAIHSSGSAGAAGQRPGGAHSMVDKLCAGLASGTLAAALLSPTELIKVRLQAPGSSLGSVGAVVTAVINADGVRGLWKGATPGVARAAVLTASQAVTYDTAKGQVMAATGWRDGPAVHFATALLTGLVSTTATNPVDVLKTHMFVGGSQHAGPLACASALYAKHGASAFMRGWAANYARLGPQTVVTFVVAEWLRTAVGLPPLAA